MRKGNVVWDVYKFYSDEFFMHFDINAPTLTKKDSAIIKKLTGEMNIDNIKEYIAYVIKNWKKIKTEFNIVSYPTVSILWGFRFSFLDYKNNKGNMGRKNSVEYVKSTANTKRRRRKFRFNS